MKTALFLVSAVTLFSTTGVYAAFTPDRLIEANKAALNVFSRQFPDHVMHITGFKSWKSDDDAKVAVYMNHDGMAMETDFDCQESGTTIDCQVSQ